MVRGWLKNAPLQTRQAPEQAGESEFLLGCGSGRLFAEDLLGHFAGHALHPGLTEFLSLDHE